MTFHTTSKIFVVGGTGAQGLPVIGALVADKKYSVRALSRDATSRRVGALLALGNVEIVEGTFADEASQFTDLPGRGVKKKQIIFEDLNGIESRSRDRFQLFPECSTE